MEQVNIIGIDLAEHSFQLHGALPDGRVAFRKKVDQNQAIVISGGAASIDRGNGDY